MSDVAIRVREIGKRYRIGERRAPYKTIRESLTEAIRNSFRARNGSNGDGNAAVARAPAKNTFWALKNICFDVERGEIVGVIGRNGAGKSTLLKILSRITDPTEGEVEICGRVGSLLEVGTGFHPELTGRENIFLNGAILGMKRAEIAAKFDEIVAFAGTEKFLDTPVKFYSSGMYTRLAFAVAAHLEPEILIVDEVLSVGDAEFQKKSLGKMGDVARSGRTVLFVSHNMHAVATLCGRCVLLECGRILMDGAATEVTTMYYAQSAESIWGQSDLRSAPRVGTGKARFTSITLQPLAPDGSLLDTAYVGCDLEIGLTIEACADLLPSNVAVVIYDSNGYRLIDVNTSKRNEFLQLAAGETASVRFRLEQLLLRSGSYVVGLWIGRDAVEEIDHIERAATLEVAETCEHNKGTTSFPGTYLCRFEQTISVLQPCK